MDAYILSHGHVKTREDDGPKGWGLKAGRSSDSLPLALETSLGLVCRGTFSTQTRPQQHQATSGTTLWLELQNIKLNE